jgi:large subunit ribosomal protein L9
MQVILQQDVQTLGLVGEIVNVKAGYARNFLVPQGLALVADPKAVRQWEHTQRLTEHAKNKAAAVAQQKANALAGVDITIPVRVGEQDKLFGSVTTRDIARGLVSLGHPIDSRRVVLSEPIRALGVYQVPIKLSAGVVAEVKVWVVADRSEIVVEEPAAEAAEPEAGDEASSAPVDAPIES